MSDVIEIRGWRLSAIVGVLAHERECEQPLVIDLEFERPFEEAAATDDVTRTTNYADVLTRAQATILEGRFALLETLVARVADAVLDLDPAIEWVRVRAHKVRPPVPQDVASLGVVCRRQRRA